MARYTFGDDGTAARRLGLVAEVFAPTSRALLSAAIPPGAGTVLDLGCGPGHTTRLVASACRPQRVLGIDASDRYVSLARSLTPGPAGPAGPTEVAFAVGDATARPLPGAPADAIHARLLLAHLPDPLAVVAGWRTQLRPGGVLVLDEVEAIEPPPGPLAEYLRLVNALVAGQGATMEVGPVLAPLGGRVVEHPVAAPVAARMFALNLATWRAAAVAAGLATDGHLDALAAALAEAAGGRTGAATVLWHLRQIVVAA